MRAIAAGTTIINAIAQRAGVPNDSDLRRRLDRLEELGYIEARRNLGAKRTTPFTYRLADPSQMFYHALVAPFEAELARYDPSRVWGAEVRPRLDVYMGHVFERIVEQAYPRLYRRSKLPMVREWSRWEGTDRAGEPVEIDIASVLADQRILTGEVKWHRGPVGPTVHTRHLDKLQRLAAAGIAWAHGALRPDAPLLYVASSGFTPDFHVVAAASGHPVYCWTLDDLYGHGLGDQAPRTA